MHPFHVAFWSNNDAREKLIRSLLLLSFYFLISFPILCAGYYNDDSPESLRRASLLVNNQTLWQSAWNWGWQNITDGGRIYPLFSLVHWPLHYLLGDHLVLYQAVRVMVILASMLPFAWLLSLTTKSREAGYTLLILIPLFWSIHIFSDPLPSFGILLPQMTLFCGLALAFYAKAETSGDWRWHILGCLSAAACLLSYEAGVVVCPAILALSWLLRRSWRAVAQATWPYMLITGLYVIAVLVSRHYAVRVMYEGIEPGRLTLFPLTFLKQITGTFPLSNIIHPSSFMKLSKLSNAADVAASEVSVAVVLCPLTATLFYRLLARLPAFDKIASQAMYGTGLCLLVVPAALIGLSSKYQGIAPNEGFAVQWGTSYQPVYIQYVGLAIICLVFLGNRLGLMARERRASAILTLAIGLGLLSAVTVTLNHRVVLRQNASWQDPRDLVEDALRRGLLSGVHVSSTKAQPSWDGVKNADANLALFKPFTILTAQTPWNKPEFYEDAVGFYPDTLFTNEPDRFLANVTAPNGTLPVTDDSLYLLDYESFPNTRGGFVILGKIKSIEYATTSSRRSITGYHLREVRLYFAPQSGVSGLSIIDELGKRSPDNSARALLVEALGEKPLASGPNWILTASPAAADVEWRYP